MYKFSQNKLQINCLYQKVLCKKYIHISSQRSKNFTFRPFRIFIFTNSCTSSGNSFLHTITLILLIGYLFLKANKTSIRKLLLTPTLVLKERIASSLLTCLSHDAFQAGIRIFRKQSCWRISFCIEQKSRIYFRISNTLEAI